MNSIQACLKRFRRVNLKTINMNNQLLRRLSVVKIISTEARRNSPRFTEYEINISILLCGGVEELNYGRYSL